MGPTASGRHPNPPTASGRHPPATGSGPQAAAASSAYDSTATGSRQASVSASSAGGGRSETGVSGLPKAGEAFAHYELVRQLGIGAFGVVWYANDTRDGKAVALKVLANVTTGSLERFKLEIKATARLAHPNIVPLHDYGEARDHPYLAMGYVDGASLKEIDDLSPEVVVEAIKDVALAVHYAHNNDVLHRDIKPDNIMLDQDGKAWILDFGLARLGESDGLTKTGDMVGTPAYMAPEQAKGDAKRVDGRCDVYSLGATLFYSLTGLAPFHKSQTIHAQLAAVLFEDPPVPSSLNEEIPKALDWIVLKCLEKKPEDRYASAAALAADLGRYLDGETVRARSPKRKAPVKKPSAPQPTGGGRAVQLAAVAVVLIAVATAIFVAVRADGTQPSATPESSVAANETPTPSRATPRPSASVDADRGRAALTTAKSLAKLGKDESAIRLASQALSENPALDEARDLRARLLAKLGRLEPALDDLSLLIEGSRFNTDLRVRRGRVLLGLARLDLAADDARIARTGKTLTLSVWILSAEIALAQNEPLKALTHLDRVGSSRNHTFRRVRGEAYLANGELDRAEAVLEGLVNERPQDGAVCLALGRVHLAQRRREAAQDRFEEGLEVGAKYAPLAVALATLYEADGRSEDALKRYRDALGWDPANTRAQKGIQRLSGSGPAPTPSATPTPTPEPMVRPTTLLRDTSEWILLLEEPWSPIPIYDKNFAANWGNRLSECRRGVKQATTKVATARDSREKAILNGKLVSQQINLGRSLAARKKYSEALGVIRRALAIEEGNSQALREQGAVLLNLGQAEEAYASLKASVERNKHDPESLRLLGIAALRANKANSAVGKLRAGITRYRSVVGLYRVLARCQVAMKRFGKAESVLKDGLRKRSRSRELLLEQALVLDRGGDYGLALKALQRHAKLNFSKSFEPWVTRFRIRVMAQVGKHDEALELAQETFQREEGEEIRTLALWALLHALTGDFEAGAIEMQKALKQKPRPEYLLLKGIFRIKAGARASGRGDLKAFCTRHSAHPRAAEIKRYLAK